MKTNEVEYRAIDPRLSAIAAQAVSELARMGVQPTCRQVTKYLGLYPDGAAKSLLVGSVQAGVLVCSREWIDAAKGEFDVYRSAQTP